MRLVFGFLLLTLLAPRISYCQPGKPLPSGFERDFTIEGSDPALSGRVAFTATVGGVDRILLLDLDTSRIRKLIDGPGNNFYPNWSPDGTELVFSSDREKKRVSYLSTWDGSNQKRVAKPHDGSENHPSWSPKGDGILVSITKGDGEESDSNLAAVNVSTGEIAPITNLPQKNVTPRWRPDGEAVSYSTDRFWPGWDICFFFLKEKKEKCPLNGNISYFRGAWSHSGKKYGYSYGSGSDIDIGILDVAQSKSTPAVELPGRDFDVAWSPDDRYILFAEQKEGGTVYNLFISDLKSAPRKLVSSKHSLRYPTWSAARTIDLEARRILESEGLLPKADPSTATPMPQDTSKPRPNPKATP